jgi:phage protein U
MADLSPAHLMSWGLFVFGMDTVPYNDFERTISWRFADQERFMARSVGQFTGPGETPVTINGKVIPELGNKYASIDTMIAMADTGASYPLMNGMGRVFGQFRMEKLREIYRDIMAGGIPGPSNSPST